jgi:hypothetical protein
MLEAYFYELGWMLFALFFGVFMGSLTGIIPGFTSTTLRSSS